jgi:nitrite reductase (NADH) large subunit
MKIVIIGAGPAGITVAETLCSNHFEGEIVMLSGEPFPPYSPPALAEYLLTGEEVHLWRGREYPAGCNVKYLSGTAVTAVMPDKKSIRLADGSLISYDRLVLASGSRLFAPLEGEYKPGIYNLKSLSAVEEMVGRIRDGRARSAIIIGAGFIGTEIGVTLADMGLKVTQLVRSRVLRSVLDEELSVVIEQLIERRGVNILRGSDADVVGFSGVPHVTGVKIQRGDVLEADLIVAATGMRPNIEYLAGSGISIDAGVLVDDHMRTNIPDISAVGDMIVAPNRVSGERYVHGNFPNAIAQAQVAAFDILGWGVSYPGADNMNSLKHLGIRMIVAGRGTGEEIRVKKGESIRKIYLQNNRIVGFKLMGDISCAGIYRTLMNNKTDVSPFRDRLLNRGFGSGYLESVASSPASWQT